MDNSTETKMNYTPEGISMMFIGVAGAVASIIYALKNIKHSECGCWKCDQKVIDNCPERKVSIV
tara:strand:- start:1021 stop:1212 length:192 start_codon:yes stop_codon:yes gene_type:complete